MTFVYPGIDVEIDTETGCVFCVAIENKRFFSELLSDIAEQCNGGAGRAVISRDNRILDFSRHCDLSVCFFPFELNRRVLLSKIVAALEKRAVSADYYEKTADILSHTESFLTELSEEFPCDFDLSKLSVSSIIKSAGIEIIDDSDSLSEKILNYMELTREFDRNKLFVFVNLRSFIEDGEFERFIESILLHRFDCLLLEGTSFPVVAREKRITIDEDLCCF